MTKGTDTSSVSKNLGDAWGSLRKAGTGFLDVAKAGLQEAAAEAKTFASDVKGEITTSVAEAKAKFVAHEAKWAHDFAIENGFTPDEAKAIQRFWTLAIPFSPKSAGIDEDGGPSSSI